MTKFKMYLLCGIAMLLVACSNDDDSVSGLSSTDTALSLDLQSMGYDELAKVLSGSLPFEKHVTLKDGAESWTVQLEQNKKVRIEENGHSVNVFKGRVQDSLSAVLSPNYATLRIQRNGELISYVSYRDNSVMKSIADHYLTQYLPNQTRVISDIVTCINNSQTRSGESEVSCVRINTTKAIESNPLKSTLKDDCIINKHDFGTSGLATYDDSPFPADLRFVLLKEKDGGALDHEIVWQTEATTTSLEFLINSGFISPIYQIRDCPYKGLNNWPESARGEFEAYLKHWDEVSGMGDKVYILMRNGKWDQETLGVATLGVIHYYKPAQNFEISAISTSSSLYPNTMAHEVGHLFGAQHVDGNKEDVMHTHFEGTETPHHLSGDNWNRMLNCWLEK